MIEVLRIVVPLGMSAAVSPVMLSEQVVLVGGPNGRRTGGLFALGTVVVLVLVVLLVALLGRSVQLPRAPHLDATADVALGAVLLGSAAALERLRRRPPRHPDRPQVPSGMNPSMALGFGAFSMATNVTTLTLVVVAVKDVTAAAPAEPAAAVALGVLVALAALPAWLPVLLAALPGHATDALSAISSAVNRHGQQMATFVLIVVGAFLVVRGAARLAGL